MRRCLLVVDDEKLVRWTIEQCLKKEAFRVLAASNAKEALEKLREEAVDVIITDLVMPEGSGMELVRHAKALRPEPKIIMMTAYGSLLDKDEARKAGVSHFIDKPFLITEVKDAVSQVLAG
ncbi:MAG: response regulator [bacterium]|nr:response regulator [bacterium]